MKKTALAGPLMILAAVHQARSSEATVYRNVAPEAHYVGSKICAPCHPKAAERYSKTGMGRSLRDAGDFTLPADAELPFTVFDKERDEYFEVSRHDGALFQSQYALDRQGNEIYRRDWKISYVISGDRGIGFLIRRDGYLFEAPLSYFAQAKLWSFSPGYERHNYAFTRPVLAECLGCHSGRAQPVYGSAGLYRDPPFDELAVGCENCHGPGELHVVERHAGRPITGKVDTSIVNPARLSGWMSDNICMKCHQAGDVRVELPGEHDRDFRPGTALETVLEIFKAPPRKDSTAGNPVLLEHYYSMTLSRCYRASSGQLHCTSCHDPHREMSGAEAAEFYRTRCFGCHDSQSCRLQASERQKTEPPDNCAGCHMPKRPVVTIGHAELTEHRIVLTREEVLPKEAFVAGDSQSGLVRVTVQPDHPTAPVPDIILFQAYARLISDGHEEFRPRMNDVLARLSRTAPKEGRVLSALARREAQKATPRDFERAIEYLTEAVNLGQAAADDFLLLAQLNSRASHHNEAIEVLKAGIQGNPYSPELAESLATEYVKTGDYKDGLDIARRGLELFPDDKVLRALMKQVQAALDTLSITHSP